MKSFRQYLTESAKTFKYRIKIAGEPDAKFLDLLRMNLSKFAPVAMTEPKSTPIQKDPYGFPGIQNQSITIFEIECRYPATEPMIKQMAKLCGWDENLVRAIQADYDDNYTSEMDQYANQEKNSPVLLHTELEDQGAAAKAASKSYSEQYLNNPGIQPDPKDPDYEFTVAGGKTAPAKDTRKDPQNVTSPMTKIFRPERPKTGAMKK
jgi:hypothetical protein